MHGLALRASLCQASLHAGAHQAFHRAARNDDPVALKLAPDFPYAMDVMVLPVDARDVDLHGGTALHSRRVPCRIRQALAIDVIGGRCDREQPAARLNTGVLPCASMYAHLMAWVTS